MAPSRRRVISDLYPAEPHQRYRRLQPNKNLVGLSGLEPLTSRLSGVCSNHLSYRPSEKQTAFRRQFLVTGQLKGIPIGLNLPNILGRKRNEAGARAIADLRIP